MIDKQFYRPRSWHLNGTQIIARNKDGSGEHESLIADVFDGNQFWRVNAKLIAAAPDLLFELRVLIGTQETEALIAGVDETPWLDSGRAAIAKATGRRVHGQLA